MKLYNKLILLLVVVMCSYGCTDFDELNTNPDTTTTVPASMLARGVILKMIQKGGSKDFINDVLLAKQFTWNENANGIQYNLIGTKELSRLQTLVDCTDMVSKAPENSLKGYQGLASFAKAFMCYYTTMDLGDIPYSEAGMGEEGILKPKFDSQKDVLIGILKDLEEAYSFFSAANDVAFEGDPVFGGNKNLWKKTVTAMQLKVLINLSKRVDDSDLNVKTRFASIVSSGSLMTSNKDNYQLVYEDKTNMRYPFNDMTTNQCKYAMHSSVLVDTLKKYNDYRLFYYAEPADGLLAEGFSKSDYDAYVGIDPSATFSVVSGEHGKKMFCAPNKRYTSTDHSVGEPLIYLGYGEQQLILAEAALRGWISGDADTYYKKGIKANMEFTRNVTPDSYVNGRVMTDEYITSYLASDIIQLTGNFERDLKLVITQKYIANFLQYPYEAWYEYRRTGYPVLPINPESSQNSTGTDKIPMRYRYANREYSFNRANLEESLLRQFNGNDDINNLMWLLK
ncbi:SusD/RagB family nutrient-binding outer membrane lipoprotein [Bacteroides sp. 519]|uniref:SusD/RagB family nutrient-binding outer membrane lipoprotein n=1 Tax=Bacteroides sp. 519 TaxID=2302937 RepID=UPI0013D0AD0F|nr:SusD/RagB family nutrient-binding outer membrane lipoprotein [Bacteroides sp. 519]NDV58298.1 SusD/RagB family nutrient-binding outer membrane lipoprotein [Bacteroides sp. 519]